jgi:assimilatory nitrate reductase catalytic subunit
VKPDAPILDLPQAVDSSTRTHCPYCAFQCGMRILDNRERFSPGTPEITPDPAFPVNLGQMCIKGITSAALLDHPDRLRSPLIREAGGGFREASWDEAFDEIAARLVRIKERHGAEALAAFGSGALTNEKAYLLGKFARLALGTPNVDYNGRYCMSSAAAAQNKAFGIDRGLPFPVADIARARTVLLWGSNCAETLPPIMQWFDRQRDNGGTLIVADPRRTETARRAQIHLQLTPGSDLALANGLLYLAIEEGLVDEDYVKARTVGFDEVRRVALQYHPARVERLTGISVEAMRRAVRLLAGEGGSMLLSGRGPEQQSKGVDSILAGINLMLALGQVGRSSGGYGCLTGQGNGQGGREHGQKADQLPGYRSIMDPEHREAVARVWGVDPDSLPGQGKSAFELLDSLGPEGGIRALLVFGSNVVVASPRANRIGEKVKQLDLLVVSDPFLNETARQAHVVLPVLQWAEEEGTMTNLEGRVVLRRQAVEPPEGVKGDIEILCELARRLGAGRHFSFGSTEEVFDELRRATAGGKADYSGITYEKIDANDGVFWPCPSVDHPGTPRLFADRFAHPDGKARCFAVDHRPAGEEPDADYPLWFVTGRYLEHYNSGAQTRRVAKLLDLQPSARLEIHPRLAGRLGVAEGAPVVVESRRGRVVFEARISREIRADTVFAPFHYGGGQAANILTNPALDPTSRMPEFKLCAVRVAPAARTPNDG